MANETSDHPHVEEAHMVNVLNNPDNTVTSDETNLTSLTTVTSKLPEQLNVALFQNKVFTDLLSKKIFDVAATQSEKQNANKKKRTDKTQGHANRMRTEEK